MQRRRRNRASGTCTGHRPPGSGSIYSAKSLAACGGEYSVKCTRASSQLNTKKEQDHQPLYSASSEYIETIHTNRFEEELEYVVLRTTNHDW
ncbi:hypothetical protein V6N12_036391 [Hibiscus sabdariffa]|uniref:Uncharacterized protein n=1 Tax=Hibiscus sabdariffa TaxID=183260 RepID=A0ABR2EQG7_9ROSI